VPWGSSHFVASVAFVAVPPLQGDQSYLASFTYVTVQYFAQLVGVLQVAVLPAGLPTVFVLISAVSVQHVLAALSTAPSIALLYA